MAYLEFDKAEMKDLEKALILLRDRHYSYYHNAKDQRSETAQQNLAKYHQLEELRNRIRAVSYKSLKDLLEANQL